jgi:TRAP-type C4-dicarboxylate transport system permease small subunit
LSKGEKVVGMVTGLMDKLAAIAMLSAMLLVVANVVLRVTVGKPILGTYEYVGFITAAIIGLAIAHCAFRNSHIAVGFIMDRFPEKVRLTVDAAVHLISALFLGLFSYHIVDYAASMALTGEVSPTTKTPFYPFIYVVAIGMSALCGVLLLRMFNIMMRIRVKNG